MDHQVSSYLSHSARGVITDLYSPKEKIGGSVVNISVVHYYQLCRRVSMKMWDINYYSTCASRLWKNTDGTSNWQHATC